MDRCYECGKRDWGIGRMFRRLRERLFPAKRTGIPMPNCVPELLKRNQSFPKLGEFRNPKIPPTSGETVTWNRYPGK